MNPEPNGPAEQRLLELLLDLRTSPPQAPESIGPRIVRSARWQVAARPYLAAAGGMIGAAGEAIGILLRPGAVS